MTVPNHRLWLGVFQWLFAAGFAMHLGRLAWIQLLNPAVPDENQLPEKTERRWERPGQRGMIVDSRGAAMALSQTLLTLRADPSVISNDAPRFATLTAPLLGIPAEVLAEQYRLRYFWNTNRVCVTTNADNRRVTNECPGLSPVQSVVVKEGVLPEEWDTLRAGLRALKFPEEDVLRLYVKAHPRERAKREELARLRRRLRQLRVLGLSADPIEVRSYPQSNLAAHVIGYVINATNSMGRPTDNLVGAMGLERQFDEQLRGRIGAVETHKVNALELTAQRELDLGPIHGMTVALTLDLGVQYLVEKALARAADELKPLGIAAVVMDPRNGDIIALANWPTFVPDNRRSVTDNAQLLNRAVFVPFEPGSTYKIFTYAIAYDLHLLRDDERIDCKNGRWVRQVGRFRDIISDDHKMHGPVTIEDAFAQSLNTVAAKTGLRIPETVHAAMLTNWGFGRRTGIPLGREAAGLIKNPAIQTGDYRWDSLTQSRMAFGYSLQVTPIQLAMGVAAIANGGWLMEPRLVKGLASADGTPLREIPPNRIARVIREETALRMQRLMHYAVTNGTGRPAYLDEWTVGGKTGTSRKYMKWEGYSTDHYYASFVGFLPVEAPELVILVVVDEPSTVGKAYYGGRAAAPVFAEIARATANFLAIRPSPRPPVAVSATPSRSASSPVSAARSQLAATP